MGLFGKKKGLVGLDIGSSAVKAVELKSGGKAGAEYQLVNVGMEPLPPEAIVDGAIMDSGAVIEAIQRLFSAQKIKTNDVATAVSGNAVIVKKISLPQMSTGGAGGVDPLGGRAVHPLRHPGRGPRLRGDRGRRHRREHGRPAGRGQEGQDQRLHLGHQPGRQDLPRRGRGRLRPPELLRDQLRHRPRPRDRAPERRGLDHEHQHREGRAPRSSTATSRWAATSTPTPSRRT